MFQFLWKFQLISIVIAAIIIPPTLLCDGGSLIILSETVTSNSINNNLFRYGMYCGPGPDERWWDLVKPVDYIDESCRDHDQAYKSCLETLSKDIGYKMPKILHQIMPVRGYIPFSLIKVMHTLAPSYMKCMNEADHNLVTNFQNYVDNNNFPDWWSNPAEAPEGKLGWGCKMK